MLSALSCRFLAVLTIAGASALLLPSGVAHAQRYDDPAGRGDYRDGPGRGAPDPGERPEEDDDGPPPPADPAYRGQTDYRQPPPAYRDEPRDRGDVAEETAGPDSGPPDVSAFYEPLDRYGRWDRHPEYGYVWIPDNVDEDWRPYTRGGWAFTDEHGWYWASEEPWGWATYHYGRWAYDGDRHWFWVPGRVWGPAWVAWRYSDDYIGWAALPPGSHDRYRAEETAFLEGPRFNHFWIFVRPRFFMSPGVGRFVQPAYVAERIMPRTRPVGSVHSGGPRAFNAGIDVREVERLSHRRVYPSRVVVSGSPGLARPSFGTVSVYRPRVWAHVEPGIAPPMRGSHGGFERRDFGGGRGAAAVPDHGYPSPGTPPSGGQPNRRSGGPGREVGWAEAPRQEPAADPILLHQHHMPLDQGRDPRVIINAAAIPGTLRLSHRRRRWHRRRLHLQARIQEPISL